ncbi:hypothetical protein MMAN_03070 [Mycobacterium mantenii]|uniref:Uncharacterized protein n=1 Tax=Mycobacterium mantenii TaxID=560555 RepID=A0A1X0F9Y8_MYCNT|nr:hypothetical protein [Mycobacterium mantenii]MCV7241888.1 hypothetical protein [Mycobacterium mantenii]ORA98631.1 hypothetical protein BST30_25525 [Mycobacterium mantenii]BBY36173.1 hypothetical protein MMAN_03070 [Mycobacterium mantenii]
MAIEPIIERDPGHKCPICGDDTELYTIGLTHWDGEKHQMQVSSPPRRRCTNLKCKGHDDGLHKYDFGDR